MFDFILQQKLIVAMLGIACLPLFMATLILVLAQVRQWKNRPRPVAPMTAEVQDNTGQENVAPSVPATANAAGTGGQTMGAKSKTSGLTTPPPTEQPAGEAVISSEMQDLLSSVFTDEETVARYQVLLKGVDPMSAEELTELSQRILAQLKGQPS